MEVGCPLPDAKFVFGVFTHHFRCPGRTPHELDINFANAREVAQRSLHFLNNDWSQRAAERCQRHGHENITRIRNIRIIYKPKIDDVDADLRVINLLETLTNIIASEFSGHGFVLHLSWW